MYYRLLGSKDYRPLLRLCWLLKMYEGEEHSTNKLLSKMRSKEYRWVLVLAVELGLVTRLKKATKNAVRPQPKTGRRQWNLVAHIDRTFQEIARTTNRGFLETPQYTFHARYVPADTWDVSKVVYQLTDTGRHFAEMATETNALQVTRTHRYRP